QVSSVGRSAIAHLAEFCATVNVASSAPVRTTVLLWMVACSYYTQWRRLHKRTPPAAPLPPPRPAPVGENRRLCPERTCPVLLVR
ncbi:MAG: hypothetical protein KAX26_15950, partial [Anaerolineae bacterium]|nr:hypothetical protein [Anaerolineae bacterium]